MFVNIANGNTPWDLRFGPDGNLYVSVLNNTPSSTNPNGTSPYGQINCYNGSTGAPVGNGVFVPLGSGGFIQPREVAFDSTGANMFVVEIGDASIPGTTGQVLRYQGPAGQNPGSYVETYVTAGQGNLSAALGLARDAAGNLYVSDRDTANVTRFAPSSQAGFVVTLDAASNSQVSVNYVTVDGTAVAGTNYTQTSGTLVFPAGATLETVNVPITTVLSGGQTKTFTMNLSSPVNATISRGQDTGSILNRMTKSANALRFHLETSSELLG